ncbi:hypothetical protein BLJ79_08530 [Arthrobacter sp. UCD-GKA]|uniref:MaoC family dehydratase n=1 Tax=Arthrobacter sp. UCD-GKA TaxID=1913576 RepID=UPI0008DDEACC|nr:MaoC family dehydratase [Arthrobacter sp. UCD-GKA]OIH85216.1 hypothetical protein BLJ79_08530 [Arthrobacter sp. UCD-GKA]
MGTGEGPPRLEAREARNFETLDEFRAAVGQCLGTSSWHHISQSIINGFAAATDDDERIHLDPLVAAATPLGTTVAHGLYTLSLGPKFLHEVYSVRGYSLALNYGFDKVRFLAPVPEGSRVRMHAELTAVSPLRGGSRFSILQTFEVDGFSEPVCVAEGIVAYFD